MCFVIRISKLCFGRGYKQLTVWRRQVCELLIWDSWMFFTAKFNHDSIFGDVMSPLSAAVCHSYRTVSTEVTSLQNLSSQSKHLFRLKLQIFPPNSVTAFLYFPYESRPRTFPVDGTSICPPCTPKFSDVDQFQKVRCRSRSRNIAVE
jgi:hypothetical protein